MTPNKKQIANMKKAVKVASEGSYKKQMAILEKYPEQLALAKKMAKF